jgi:TRAP-type C4-dicarboxylate transport system substrate-binding protein
MSTKSKFLMLLMAAALLTGSAVACWAKMELPMSTVYMNTHPTVVNGWTPWFAQMKKLTGGEVELAYFNPNTLTPLADHYDSTISGMLGVGGNDMNRTPGKFPLSGVLDLPGLAPSAECGSLILNDLVKKYPSMQKEFSEIKLLWNWASATFQLNTTKKPVKTLADLKGMKIICWSRPTADIMSALGASTVLIPPTDTYLALERGMADGVFCPLAPVVSFKINEAAKYTTICDMLVTGFWAGMSHDLWDSLSDKAKKAFEQTTGENMARISGKTLDEGAAKDSVKLRKKGHTFIVLSDAERAKWLDATKSLREKWIKDMEGKGYKEARAMVEDAFKLSAKYSPITGRGFKE